jgi:esterase/lipase superfamily enzyme
MHTEHHRWFSHALGHDMDLKLFGHYGKPILVFPAQDGRWYDFENFGMVGAIAHLIEAGRVKLICVDGVDWQSWTNKGAPPTDRANRHEAYDAYIMNEVVPWVRNNTGQDTMWVTGCSMGAYHSANFFFRHPDAFDGVIALSGLYQVSEFVGDHGGDAAYFNSPLWYLEHMGDPWFLNLYRRSTIVFAVGQGAWEERMIEDTRRMQQILESKGVPAWIDYWGHDVAHDWPWWRKMLPHFLEKLL